MKERRKGRKVAAGEEGDGLKKGPWTAAEDAVLAEYVREHGEGNWNAVQRNSGLSRCGKSCRLRWANHLRPNLKKGAFSPDEELLILRLHAQLGNKWARMASHLPGRTDNEIKNYWNTRIKRRLRAGLPLYPPEIQSLAANQLSPTSPNPPPSPAAPTFTLSFLDPSTLPPVPAPVPPLVTHVPFLNPPPQLPPIRRYRSADGLIFQATVSPPPPPISPMYHQPLGFDPGSFEVGAGGPISHPTSLSVKTELPSNQLFPDAVCQAGDSGGESLGRTNSGLLDALLEEAQGLGDRQRGELTAEVPAGRENLLFFWADDENGEICTAGAGETKTRRVLANEINLVQEDISTLLDMIPTAPLPLSPVVPDWYNDDNGEMSNGHSSVVTEDDIGLDIQQLASSIPVSPQDQVWSIGSCTWNNMPGIC